MVQQAVENMEIRQYIADAFTDRLFGGNQAAVCLPGSPLSEEQMRLIARENNFSETAFAVKTPDGYDLRWFTPGGEIDLCGHATLATAFIIMTEVSPRNSRIAFSTLSGILTVQKRGELYSMDFPQAQYHSIEVTDEMCRVFNCRPKMAFLGRDLLLVCDSENEVRDATPDVVAMRQLPGLCRAITARGAKYDCVSRVFAPELDVSEDPVTGSTHCMIAPYWAGVLGKNRIRAWQASRRGGQILCQILDNGRIELSGKCQLYSKGTIFI